MVGHDPAIHVFASRKERWMPGQAGHDRPRMSASFTLRPYRAERRRRGDRAVAGDLAAGLSLDRFRRARGVVARALAQRTGAQRRDHRCGAGRRAGRIRHHRRSRLSRPARGRPRTHWGSRLADRWSMRRNGCRRRRHAAGQQGQHPRHPLLRAQRVCACRRGRQSDIGAAGAENGLESVIPVTGLTNGRVVNPAEAWPMRAATAQQRRRPIRRSGLAKRAAALVVLVVTGFLLGTYRIDAHLRRGGLSSGVHCWPPTFGVHRRGRHLET